MKRLLRNLTLITLLLVSLCQAQDSFASPEETINHYLDGLSQNNLAQLIEASAADEMATGFDFKLQVERLGGFLPLVSVGAPTDYALYTELNRLQYSSQLLGQAKVLTLGLLADLEAADLFRLELEPAAVDTFVSALNPGRLADLEVQQISHPDETLLTNERYLESSQLNARIYGADEQTERVVLLSFENRYYLLGFTLLRYGNNWLISKQHTPFADTDPSGMATEITVEAFEELFGSD